jgi:stage II sporulation protein E
MKSELNFKTDYEKTIRLALSDFGVERIIVIEDKYGKYDVTLAKKPCYGRKVCVKEIIPIVNKILDRNMKSQDAGCNISKEEKLCNIKLVEEQKYKVIHGVARAVKNNSQVSGDNYSFMEIKNDQCLMALSDGMGSGSRANRESAASIELLEEFLESGFDKDVAVKMINSALVLKSAEESFSTIDMCIIDMHEAIAEFIKIGAASTYIKRGSEIQIISSTSLPAGILSNVDMEVTKKRLKDGDIIVMITDGITDSSNEIIKHTDSWLEKALREMKTNNPQDIAEYILQRAKDNANGAIEDDMTVLVAKFWEKY